MAKAKRSKSALKFGEATPALAEKGYVKCPTCRRDIKDADAHQALHDKGIIGDDGKRTDRSKDEAKRWAERYNGTEATEQFRREQAKAKKSAKKAKAKAKKVAAKKAS